MSREIDRRTVLAGTAAGLTATVAGCLADSDDDDGEDVEDVEIQGSESDRDDVMLGVLQPSTGDLGDLGTPIRDAAELPGIQLEGETDFTIDAQTEDSESDPEAGISAANALVDAGYPAVTGAASSEVTSNALEDVWVPNGITAISPASTSPELTDFDDDGLFFRTCPSDAWQSQAMAELGYEEEGFETAASFHLNNEYGELLSQSFVEAFEDLGGEVTAEEAFEAEQPSYTSALQNVLNDDPELLIVIGYPESGEQIFRDYYAEFDGDQTIMVTDGLQEGSLPADVDNPMENVIGTAPGADGPAVDAFAEAYEDEFGYESVGVFTAQAYDASAVLLLANVAAGENDGEAIRNQVRNVANPGGEEIGPDNLAEGIELVADGEDIEYQGASSTVQFDDNGDMETVTYDIFGFSEDGVETVDTVEFEAE